MKVIFWNAALIGLGGFIGALCRYGLSGIVQRSVVATAFPYGTLVVNMSGCLMIGLAVGLIDARPMAHPQLRSFILVGLLGGFTTYSTFALESFALLKDAEYTRALASVLIHVVGGLVLVWAGYSIASR